MLTLGVTSGCEESEDRYNWNVREFTIGDVIRKARQERRWSQTKLGEEATYLQVSGRSTSVKPINKSTVSKVERTLLE